MHPVEDVGALVGVGVTMSCLLGESYFHGIGGDGETNHDRRYDFPDDGTGVG
ncbi:MAG TPA: hypothetical protein PLN56_08820 [Methanoregulaceae archaeon]|nr:MAG: hypothetical protein IPI71_04675 [Methanolinea sp.]HON82002.1 hypothetical protein [Methanoregulaceae archaeon]HPD11083.1 hypothetical protein [Methanoregulaceae archaeon]HRT15944.1 hypothetical protein [Methanoregulaceae archaeon]HRU31409.1 hypothetical protein [Methanoregulaceae archaeon]